MRLRKLMRAALAAILLAGALVAAPPSACLPRGQHPAVSRTAQRRPRRSGVEQPDRSRHEQRGSREGPRAPVESLRALFAHHEI
jgi:hypothetical protein